MPRIATFPSGTTEHLAALLKEKKEHPCFRKIQAVYLGSLGQSTTVIAAATLYTPEYVKLLFHQYREKGDLLFEDHQKGKKNHAYVTFDQEVAFLAPFIATAEKAGILIAADVHRALKKKLGKEDLSIQTTYNLLHRHNWRKIAPRPYHPKRDSVARELWKTEIFPPEGSSSKANSTKAR